MKLQRLFPLILPLLAFSSCTKEYVTNEYITNEYVTNEYVYNKEYYSTILSQQQEITERIRPAYLKAGDTVAICATSNYVTKAQMENGKSVLESWGLVVVEADNLYNQDGRYAGTIADRVEGLQKMIDNPNVKAIIAARGGYGCAQIMAMVDLKPMVNNPKWVVGYSDVSVLLISLNNVGVETIHGPMAKDFSDEKSVACLKDALFGKLKEQTIETNANCIQGKAEGRLVGGNLSMIYSLGGTLFDLNAKNAILFIEDTGESNYSLDRMLTNLKLSGKLDYVKGIVVGDFTSMNQGNDKSVEEIIHEKVVDLGIPVMYGLQAGHATRNLSLYLGRDVTMEVGATNATLTFK
ncbi:MAG: LD-carboxypeptidase [Paludibacteraceae bacterium]|nr:LD-carboxypeptidase [Paludibacteraceae bacterium]